MPVHTTDRASSQRDSIESLDNLEMHDRGDGGSAERLLPDGDGLGVTGGQKRKSISRVKLGCAIVGLMVAAMAISVAVTLIIGNLLVKEFNKIEDKAFGDFRRPAKDYILDPAWDFDAPRQIRTYKWTIVDIEGNPDGVFRPLLTINGQFPGPLIECNEGDTLSIEVDNQSVNSTALHFHGIFQNGTNFMDGTPGLTQCPIAPGRTFRYEFTISGQSGTYYYHGHMALQASDGLFGPLIVHSRDERMLQKVPYSSDRVLMVQDYYHDPSSVPLLTSLESGNEGAPIPDGALINGLNQRDCSALPHRKCDNFTATLPSFNLAADATHRLRLINVGALAAFQVSVDEHEFSITEVDGTDIFPVKETSLLINAAQRYSLVIRADQTTAKSFWLRARMMSHCWNEPDIPGDGANEVKAVVHYSPDFESISEIMAHPSTTNSVEHAIQCKDMNTTAYIPVAYRPAPHVADHSYYLRSNIEIGDWRLERGFFNTSTFRPNLQEPTLHRTIEGLASGNASFTASSSTDGVNSVAYDLKNNFLIQHSGIKVVDLIIQNFDEGNHPMHLHGHKFWILGQGHGYFPGYETLGMKENGHGVLESHEGMLEHLMIRDVASIEGYGWLALRFVADNPGVWAFHCHMAFHSEAGLAMQFLSRVDEVAKWKVPEESARLCQVSLEELEKGSTPKDSLWFGSGIGR